MRRSSLVSIPVALTFVLFMFLTEVHAGVYSGTLSSVSAEAKRISIKFSSKRKGRSFRLSSTTRVTLNGKKTTLEKLEVGQRVSVFTNSAGNVLRVRARSSSTGRSSSGLSKVRTKPRSKDSKDSSTKSKTSNKRSRSRRSNSSRRQTGSAVGSGVSWPGFRGPNRDNISAETGLLRDWSGNAPRLAWSASGLGEGYSTVSVDKPMVFTMGNQGGSEAILALNLEDGKPLWSAPTGGSAYRQGRGNGPRGTPTLDGNEVYALGAQGDLACVEARTGKLKWSKNILREFGGSNISWGISESVLIDGDRLICTPGGRRATMVALNKRTGNVIWGATAPGNPKAGYASPIVADVGGVRQYITFTSRGVISVRAADGTSLWQDSSSSNGTANCSTPMFSDGYVFSASGYGAGGSLLQLSSSGNRTRARQVYHTREMKNHHGGMLIVDGYLYGSNDPGILTCLELKTGRVMWKDRSVGKGSIAYADGHIYLRSEQGPVALVEATPAGYREKGRFNQPQRSGKPAWPHPVVADGKLFLRDMDVLLAYDLK